MMAGDAVRQRRRSEDGVERAHSQSPEASRRREDTFQRGVFGSMSGLLLGPLRTLAGGKHGDVDLQTAAERFCCEMAALRLQPLPPDDGEGGSNSIVFMEAPYREALARAAREERLLLVYLHSGQHPDSEKFVRDVLAAPQLVELVNTHMVAWGGCVELAEAHRLSGLLHASTYPYVAILEPPANSNSLNSKLLDRMEGATEFGKLFEKVKGATDRHGSTLASRAAARFEAEERQRLREEQDEALQQTMEEDRRREEERRQREQEELRKETEERIARERLEEEERSIVEKKKRAIEEKRAGIRAEPEKGEVDHVTTIRFRLPNGSTFQRRFRADTTMGEVRRFVDCKLYDAGSDIVNYSLVSNFPKKEFRPEEDAGSTLEENDLIPQVALLIQDLDS